MTGDSMPVICPATRMAHHMIFCPIDNFDVVDGTSSSDTGFSAAPAIHLHWFAPGFSRYKLLKPVPYDRTNRGVQPADSAASCTGNHG